MKILSTGIDIVEVKRIKSLYLTYGKRFLGKILNIDEADRLENKGKSFYQSLAARIAAKEAIYKALNSYDPRLAPKWKDISIYNQDNGSPSASFNFTLDFGATIALSISHADNYAVASAILLRED
ncbi:MAG: holo-ACP synthase [Candidatus Omnitrophica bacterium]|nr:holo-ACP synthase [Candidatus Omnitrophota bacterium]